MNLSTNTQQTMTSKELLELVNAVRSSFGEPLIRLNKFNEKIEDELEGEYYTKSVVQNSNNTTSICYELSMEQCTLIGMRESKGVRKNVLHKLKELEKEQYYIPQTYGDALQLCADQAKQLELQAPKVNFYDKLADRTTLMNATQVAQKISMSAQKLNKILDTLNVYSHAVKRGRVFKQWFIDQGYGELKETDLGYSQAMFTTKGEQWVFEKLTSEGLI
jgi:phage antirepressor YoqD-like protein